MRSEIIIVAYLSQSFCSTFFLLIKDFLSVITNSEKCGENENDTFNYSKRKYVVLLRKKKQINLQVYIYGLKMHHLIYNPRPACKESCVQWPWTSSGVCYHVNEFSS